MFRTQELGCNAVVPVRSYSRSRHKVVRNCTEIWCFRPPMFLWGRIPKFLTYICKSGSQWIWHVHCQSYGKKFNITNKSVGKTSRFHPVIAFKVLLNQNFLAHQNLKFFCSMILSLLQWKVQGSLLWHCIYTNVLHILIKCWAVLFSAIKWTQCRTQTPTTDTMQSNHIIMMYS